MVGPGPEFLHDPGRQRGGGVHQRVANRLRPGRVLTRIPRIPLGRVLQRGQRRPLGVGQVGERGRIGPGQRRDEVDARHVGPVLLAEGRAHAGAPVAAHRAVTRVAQPLHQDGPSPRDPLDAPPSPIGLAAEPVTGQRRADDVKRASPGPGRVGQRSDHLQELHHRPRPPVRHDQRQRIRPCGSHMDKVDGQPVDLRPELRQPVQPRLGRPPVIPLSPVLAQLAQVIQRHPLRPVGHRLPLRPARLPQPPSQVGQLSLGDLDPERDNLRHASTLCIGSIQA